MEGKDLMTAKSSIVQVFPICLILPIVLEPTPCKSFLASLKFLFLILLTSFYETFDNIFTPFGEGANHIFDVKGYLFFIAIHKI